MLPLLQDFIEHFVGDFLDLVGLLLVQEPTENLVQIRRRIGNRFNLNYRVIHQVMGKVL